MEEILNKYPLLKNQNVSRETLVEFESFIAMLQRENEKINIISKETAKNDIIRQRHIEDSAQIIEFVDLNSSNSINVSRGTFWSFSSGYFLKISSIKLLA